MKKSLLYFFLFIFLFTLQSCKDKDSDSNDQDPLLTQAHFVSIEVNPTVVFLVDDDDTVLSLDLVNRDAEIVYAEMDLIGETIDDALASWIEAVVRCGYLEPDVALQSITIASKHTDDTKDTDFRDRIGSVIEDTLEPLGIAAMILDAKDVDRSVQELMQNHDLSEGHARIVNHYLALFDDVSLEEAMAKDVGELIHDLSEIHASRLEHFKEELESDAKTVKDQLIDDVSGILAIHNQAIASGLKERIDPTDELADYIASYEQNKSNYETKMSERLDSAETISKGLTPSHMTGEYVYEVADGDVGFIVTYEVYTLNDDGTYAYRFSWASSSMSSQTTTGTGEGTWEVVDGSLVLTNTSGQETVFRIYASRIAQDWPMGFQGRDGIVIRYFRKM